MTILLGRPSHEVSAGELLTVMIVGPIALTAAGMIATGAVGLFAVAAKRTINLVRSVSSALINRFTSPIHDDKNSNHLNPVKSKPVTASSYGRMQPQLQHNAGNSVQSFPTVNVVTVITIDPAISANAGLQSDASQPVIVVTVDPSESVNTQLHP